MAQVKLAVIYPRPADMASFERIYQTQHVPLAVDLLERSNKPRGG